jgi:hypothetical protein
MFSIIPARQRHALLSEGGRIKNIPEGKKMCLVVDNSY